MARPRIRPNSFFPSLSGHDIRFQAKLSTLIDICLAFSVLLAFESLMIAVIPSLKDVMASGFSIPFTAALAAVACAVGLFSSFLTTGARRLIATAVIFPALADVIVAMPRLKLNVATFLAPDRIPKPPGEMALHVALAFLGLGILQLVIRAEGGFSGKFADVLMALIAFDVLILDARTLYQWTHISGPSQDDGIGIATYLCVTLLSISAFLLRAPRGVFGILTGSGVASGIARLLTPIVLILPFIREAVRARILRAHFFPEQTAIATMASTAAVISIALVIIVCWYVRRMELTIQDLSIRDELTGLYNLRGFRLLAEQAHRLARRSNLPFSVLFVDLDNLKQVNDTLGHAIGSDLLVEASELLKGSFRDADVIGRIGGDEFVVAGQFSHFAVSKAAERLQDYSGRGTSTAPLSMSVGFVTAESYSRETLQDLMDRADAAMYEQKRLKKLQLC